MRLILLNDKGSMKMKKGQLIPKPLPTEDYSTLIKLAEEANAYPVIIGVVFSKYYKDDDSQFKCGGEYLVKITRLKEL